MNIRKEVTLAEYIKGKWKILITKSFFLLRLFFQLSTIDRIKILGLILGQQSSLITLNKGTTVTIAREDIFSKLWFLFDMQKMESRIEAMPKYLNLHLEIKSNLNYIMFKYDEKNLFFQYSNNNELLNSLMVINITYVEKKWSIIKCANNIVFDIGANVGDSAIYFILTGAKRVIAIEPFTSHFKRLLDNVKTQNLGGGYHLC